jgi:predicted RNA-binding Zn-ribbon protein involved in translation (DUF1610 family)
MANYWKETCVNCGREFLNNSGTTSFGCPDYCDALLRAEDYCLRTFGAPQRCPYVINPDAFGEDCEPCGKVAKYALIVNYAEWKPTVAFCKSHFWVVWNKADSMANELPVTEAV